MTKKKTDLRVLRTNKMIFDAFIDLVEEKGYDSITIQDIANRAMINRATFYAHFKDKQDLYEQVFEFALSTFTTLLDSVQLVDGNRVRMKEIEKMMTSIYERIRQNKAFFMTLTEGNANELMRIKLAQLLEEKYTDIFSKLRITENDIEVPIDFIIEYISSIFIGMVHWWIHSNSDFPPEHMARLTIKLVGNGHLTVLGIEVEK